MTAVTAMDRTVYHKITSNYQSYRFFTGLRLEGCGMELDWVSEKPLLLISDTA